MPVTGPGRHEFPVQAIYFPTSHSDRHSNPDCIGCSEAPSLISKQMHSAEAVVWRLRTVAAAAPTIRGMACTLASESRLQLPGGPAYMCKHGRTKQPPKLYIRHALQGCFRQPQDAEVLLKTKTTASSKSKPCRKYSWMFSRRKTARCDEA